MSAQKPYRVDLWGSKPGENDDCFTGQDFDTKAEAQAVFKNPDLIFLAKHLVDVTWIELDGPDIHEEREIVKAKVARREDRAWRHELAMEAGMLGGCDAYNEAMGYD